MKVKLINRYQIGDFVLINKSGLIGMITNVDEKRKHIIYEVTVDELTKISCTSDEIFLLDKNSIMISDHEQKDRYIGEVRTIYSDDKYKIKVNPDIFDPKYPYFKIYKVENKFSTSVTCVDMNSFEVSRTDFYDYKNPTFYITGCEVDEINEILNTEQNGVTIWNEICFYWNFESNFIIEEDVKKYCNGDFDKANEDVPTYVPSTLKLQPINANDQMIGR